MSEKILITGGAGFIGSYICRKLIELNHMPIVYDSFVQYISPFDSLYQTYLTERFLGIKDKIIFERGDTRDKSNVRRVISKHKPDRIIHLAALPIADLSNTHSEEALSSILQGAVNVLEIARDVDFIKRVVYTSSSMIYGDFQYTPADEEHPKKPKDIYGGTKYAGEILVETFGRRYGIKYTIIRPSAVYGPTDVNRRVSQIFVENAILGKTLTLHRGGDNVLDFTFVEDTADGFVKATFSDNAVNQIFNITRGEGRTLKEFVDILKTIIPNIKTIETEGDLFRPKRGALDISKARKLLGYEPKYSLEQGLKKYVEFVLKKFEEGKLK
ncbi:MAG TPA: GDP-mannose 4,6-dehydratase [bacterium]|nr:GDP-mannose 4,6-dehydratase [bacterium]HPP86329.1 GDP-mannose 4,6-dehydratase [bacterium]